jgi:hypothetical protein
MLPRFQATRYVVPLREGGSLPAVLDTAGGGLHVVKFRGAGQGEAALIAELVVALLARCLDLPVPEPALVDLDESFGRGERDPEIQDLLRASAGVNAGFRYLEGAFNFDVVADLERVDPGLAARIVWLDAFALNPDRTARNPNLLMWRGSPWLIDHGTALYFHHDWEAVTAETARGRFPAISHHVLLGRAGDPLEVDEELAARLDTAALEGILGSVPDALLVERPRGVMPPFADAASARRAYVDLLAARLEAPRAFAREAHEARQRRLAEPPAARSHRR